MAVLPHPMKMTMGATETAQILVTGDVGRAGGRLRLVVMTNNPELWASG